MEIYAEITLYVTICFCLATLGMGLCAICGNYWIDASTYHYGLWKYCFKYQGQVYNADCYDIRDILDVEGYHTFTQVFFVVGVALSLVILIMLVLLIIVAIDVEDRKLFLFSTIILCIIQAVVLFIALAVFQAKTDNQGSTGLDQDWTTYLGWTTAVLSFATTASMALHVVLNRGFYSV